ncbi:hypothetical protein ABZ023_35055 [Streptomyces sp. NPDC006367]|uniref:hypothetical protein n=1 Tax=unclassified Streptomyces TaxID=2593676 RepID=UPI0033AE3BC2
MSIYDDIAAIVYPMPEPGDVPEDVYNDVCRDVDSARKELALNLEGASDSDPEGNEPLMSAIGAARYRKEQAEAEIRRLVAYGREFTRPRPYKLADLAAASGMSVSGVRTCYGHGDVAAVEQATARKPREWRSTDPADPPEAGSQA